MPIGPQRQKRQTSLRWRPGVWLAVVSVVVLASCVAGDGDGETPTVATPTTAIEPSPAPSTQLGELTWTTGIDESGAPVDILEEFSRHDLVIYAAVEVENAPAGETLSANWSLDEEPIDAIDSTVTIDSESETGWVAFTLTWDGDSLWPTGVLGIEITASSGATSSGEVQITSS